MCASAGRGGASLSFEQSPGFLDVAALSGRDDEAKRSAEATSMGILAVNPPRTRPGA